SSGDTNIVDYVVMEAGTWNIQDGAGTRQVIATTTKSISAVEGGGSYGTNPGTQYIWPSTFSATPVVIATVSSYNSTDWMFAHVSDGANRNNQPDTTNFATYLGRSHAASGSYTEDIDVVAFAPGHGSNNNVEYDAVAGPDGDVTHTPAAVSFSSSFSSAPSITLVMQGAEQGGNGATALRHTGTTITASAVSAALDEDGSGTGDRNHTSEPISVIAFADDAGLLYTNSVLVYDFAELEYSIQATANSQEGVGYCFRVTDAGAPISSYDVYPEATLNSDVIVSATGTQTATVDVLSTNNYLGGTFVITENTDARSVESITVTESGSIDAAIGLENIELYYENDTSLPYNCASETYGGSELQFGATDTDGFSATNGSSTFTDSVAISTTSSLCVYVVSDITASASDVDTIELDIFTPSNDVTVDVGSVGPGSTVRITGSTTVQAASLVQSGYHWRNNDGDEVSATSATGGNENTALSSVQRGSIHRARFLVSNTGGAGSAATQYRLEYGVKNVTCEAASNWQDIDLGAAFVMASTSQLIDGNDTTNITVTDGGVTDPSGDTFLASNGGQKEDDSTTASVALGINAFTELEYSILVTDQSGFDTTYCFRITAAGAELDTYTTYAELTTQEQQDYFVQRGTETITGTSTILTAGIDYTAPAGTNTAFIRITNTHMTGAGGSAAAQDTPDDFTAYILNPENLASSITIARPATANDDTQVSWEIIEYIGIRGADNEMLVHDVGTVTYTGSALFATGTAVTGIIDDTDVVVFITGQDNPDTGTENYNTGLSMSSWHATSAVPVFERGDADGVASNISSAVVEFGGVNWNIQRVEHTYSAEGVTETEPITPVNAISRTFLHAQKIVGDELYNLDEAGHEVFLSSLGAISLELESGATTPSDHRSAVWVIENTQTGSGEMEVHQSDGTVNSGGGSPATFTLPIGDTVNISNASIWAVNQSTGGGNFHPRAFLGTRIVNSTQYEFYRADDGQNQDYRVEVVEWPVAELSIRQNYYRLYVDNDTVTPTDPWPVGASDLGENTAMTDLDEPVGATEHIRIRMTLFVNNASLVADSQTFTLQYG
ncbi:MAG: hypothetical protein AAFO91_01190, partial [Bacteroidota bacterium]